MPSPRQLEALRLRSTPMTWEGVAEILRIRKRTARQYAQQACMRLKRDPEGATPDHHLARGMERIGRVKKGGRRPSQQPEELRA